MFEWIVHTWRYKLEASCQSRSSQLSSTLMDGRISILKCVVDVYGICNVWMVRWWLTTKKVTRIEEGYEDDPILLFSIVIIVSRTSSPYQWSVPKMIPSMKFRLSKETLCKIKIMKKSCWSSQLHSQKKEKKTIHFYNPEHDVEKHTLEDRNLFTEYDTDDDILMKKGTRVKKISSMTYRRARQSILINYSIIPDEKAFKKERRRQETR